MKGKIEDLIEEIQERMKYYLSKADDEENKTAIGHYIEAKTIKERIEEILYEDER